MTYHGLFCHVWAELQSQTVMLWHEGGGGVGVCVESPVSRKSPEADCVNSLKMNVEILIVHFIYLAAAFTQSDIHLWECRVSRSLAPSGIRASLKSPTAKSIWRGIWTDDLLITKSYPAEPRSMPPQSTYDSRTWKILLHINVGLHPREQRAGCLWAC